MTYPNLKHAAARIAALLATAPGCCDWRRDGEEEKMEVKCWHHPKRSAVAVTNLGAVIDLDTYVCQACLDKIIETWGEDKIVKRI